MIDRRLKIKFGFTLIEVMISIVIIGMLLGGGLVYLNSFNSRQELQSAKDELVAALRLARTYAVTGQTPSGFTGVLQYVSVTINTTGNATVKAVNASDIGTSYFSKKIATSGIGVTAPADLGFSIYSGKLVKDNGSSIVPLGTDRKITIRSTEGIGDTKIITIKTSGLVDEQ